jgi:hypothetical protein
MMFSRFRSSAAVPAVLFCLIAGFAQATAQGQSPESSSTKGKQSSSNQNSSSIGFQREKAPSLVDPAGPTISLISSEPVFLMASALNACGYDEGLDESAPVRKHVREEMNDALPRARTRATSATRFVCTLRNTA